MSTPQNAPTNRDYTKLPSYITLTGDIVNNDTELLRILYQHLESSKAYLRSNKAWQVADINRKILWGDNYLNNLSDDTRIEIHKLRRQGREIVGNAANIRPNFSIRTPKSDDDSANKSATYEDLKEDWWQRLFIDRTFKEGTQEAACSIGYLWLWPKPDPNTGQIEITPEAKAYNEVYPYQMGADNNIDKAYSITVRCEIPINQFREEFPEYADSITPDRSAPSYLGKGLFRKAQNKAKGLRAALRRGLERKTDSIADPSFPTVDVFYTWTRDITINRTGKAIRMGTLNATGDLMGHESYEVPSYELGVNRPKDCKLFPFRRLTIWTWGQILFDGPPKWICFGVPVAELRFERLPKEWMGIPVLNDGRSLEAAINKMINSIKERIEAKAEFPIGIDETFAQGNKQIMQRLMKYGLRALKGKGIKLNFRAIQKPIQALFDKDLFGIEQHEFEVIKDLMEMQDYVVGTNDYSNIQRKNQIPAADTQEALIQSLGVLSVDHEREISLGVARFGRIWLQFAPQVYTLKKRLTIIGSPAMDLKDIDYDPENLVPSSDPKKDNKPYWVRLKEHLEKFNLIAMPGSLQERQSVTNKLTLLQMLKSGVPISTRKLYNVFINDGKYDDTRAEWKTEQEENAILAAKIRMEVEKITGAGGSPEGGNIMQQLVSALQLQNTSKEGRPSSDAASPRQEIKTDQDGTSRATTATYGK